MKIESSLESGLKVYLESNMKDRIELSNGIEEVHLLNDVVCKFPTYVPTKPWRIANAEELKILKPSIEELSNYQIVGIISLPIFLKTKFKKLSLNNCNSYSDLNKITETEEFKDLQSKTITYFEKWAVNKNSAIPHNIYMGEPGLSNNTFNKMEEYYIGMHLDSWERKSFIERPKARNRICINLGKEPRYLLFYNLTYKEMALKSGFTETFINSNHSPNDVLYKFYSDYSKYPIVKIKIYPYEAYLAPTENIIHDGCTEGNQYKDINFAFRGYYKIPTVKTSLFQKIKSLIVN